MQILLRELCAAYASRSGHLVIPTDGGRDVAVSLYAQAGAGSPEMIEIGLNCTEIMQTAVLYREGGRSAVVARPLGYEDRIMAGIASPCAEIGQYASAKWQ